MSTCKVPFQRIKDCLPGVAAGTALNLKSDRSIDWLGHIGPDGRHWHALWVDIAALRRWANLRYAHFSPALIDELKRCAVISKDHSTTEELG